VRYRRGAVPLAGAIEALAARVAPATLLADVQQAWPQVAGELMARQAEPMSEREGTVTLACSSAVWAQELELLGPGLVDGLNAALGAPRVTALRCRVGTGRARG
jgi:predicted nucleic acid-binding Zn ribbon protein